MTVVDEIKAVLDHVAETTSVTELGRVWTANVISGLKEVGVRKGYRVYGSKCESDGHEWVFDLCWLEYTDGWLKSMPLALESEWHGWSNAQDDFQKLLIARAELKVFVFSARTVEKATQDLRDLRRYVAEFKGPGPDGDYLLCCWCNATRKFTYDHLIHRS